MAGGFGFAHLANVSEPVIILRPVHQTDIARIRAWCEIATVGDPAVEPQPPIGTMQIVFWIECMRARPERDRITHRPAQELAWPGGLQCRHVVAPELVPSGLFDPVIFPRKMVHGETVGECLNVGWPRFSRCVR